MNYLRVAFALAASIAAGDHETEDDSAFLLQHSFAFETDGAFTKQLRPSLDLTSKELGNFISYWYLGSMPFEHEARACNRHLFEKVANAQCRDGMCFGRHLAQQLDKGVSLFEPAQETDVRTYVARYPPWDKVTYHYDGIRAVLPHMGRDLWKIMLEYATMHNPQLLAHHAPTYCVVHYRVGDLVKFNYEHNRSANIVSVESMASAVASLRPQPLQECRTVEILNGGIGHIGNGGGVTQELWTNESKQEMSSWETLRQLQSSIQKRLPTSEVFIQAGGSEDEDFFKMATAPGFAFAAGSFASTAAVAGRINQIRSPAAEHLLFPQEGSVVTSEIRPGWSTFDYELQPVVVSDWVDESRERVNLSASDVVHGARFRLALGSLAMGAH